MTILYDTWEGTPNYPNQEIQLKLDEPDSANSGSSTRWRHAASTVSQAHAHVPPSSLASLITLSLHSPEILSTIHSGFPIYLYISSTRFISANICELTSEDARVAEPEERDSDDVTAT